MRVNAIHFHKVVTLVCFLLQVFEFEIHQGGKRGDFLPVEGKRTKWVSFLSLLWKNSRIQNNTQSLGTSHVCFLNCWCLFKHKEAEHPQSKKKGL